MTKDEALKMAILLLECPHITEGRINVVVDACKEALQSEANSTKELQFIYDDLIEEYVAVLDDRTCLLISGGNRTRWFNKIRGIWYE